MGFILIDDDTLIAITDISRVEVKLMRNKTEKVTITMRDGKTMSTSLPFSMLKKQLMNAAVPTTSAAQTRV